MDRHLLESLAVRLRSKGFAVPPGDLEALLDAAIAKLREGEGNEHVLYRRARELFTHLRIDDHKVLFN